MSFSHLRHPMRLILGICALLGLLAAGTVSASASNSRTLPTVAAADDRANVEALSDEEQVALQAEIDEQLAQVPGGRQISANELVWGDSAAPVLVFGLGEDSNPEPSSALEALYSELDNDARAAGKVARSEGGIQDEKVEGCPMGNFVRWYCFYNYKNFNKGVSSSASPIPRRLQWSHPYCDGEFIDLADWGFSKKVTSWVNTGWLDDIRVYTGGMAHLWTMREGISKNAQVASSDNNKARFVVACP